MYERADFLFYLFYIMETFLFDLNKLHICKTVQIKNKKRFFPNTNDENIRNVFHIFQSSPKLKLSKTMAIIYFL